MSRVLLGSKGDCVQEARGRQGCATRDPSATAGGLGAGTCHLRLLSTNEGSWHVRIPTHASTGAARGARSMPITNTELSGVRSYAFGGGGSGATSTDSSTADGSRGGEAAGSLSAKCRSEELTVVETPQLAMASQQRACVGVEQSFAGCANALPSDEEGGPAVVDADISCNPTVMAIPGIACPRASWEAHARSPPTRER